jgi:RNA polymerase primary sigma factor
MIIYTGKNIKSFRNEVTMINENKKTEFNEILSELIELSQVSGNILTKDQIQLYFKDIISDENMYNSIYSYLLSQNIIIKDLDADINSLDLQIETEDFKAVTDSETASLFHKMYTEELESISTNLPEKKISFNNFINDPDTYTQTLTHHYLPTVLDIVDSYKESILPKSELIAEGNLALFNSIIEFKNEASSDFLEFENYIINAIKKALEYAINSETNAKQTTNHLVDRINRLNDATTEIAKELEREPSLTELSEKLSLSEDEIRELMKISIDALTVIDK